jgi:hypothetical protein
MSDKKIGSKTIKSSVKSLAKAAHHELKFAPNKTQERIKARFYRRLEELSHVMDKETVLDRPELIEQLAGTERIHRWLTEPAFASWFLDASYVVDTISSLQSQAVNVLQDLLTSDSPDRLKAAKILLELGDQFPGRKSEVRFLDDRLNNMSALETDKEIAKLQQQLEIEAPDEEE